jgi:acetyl-CoA acetyltransferase
MPEAVIVPALRTPIGTAKKGALHDTDAYALCSHGHPVAASAARISSHWYTNCAVAEAESASRPCVRAAEWARPRSSRFRRHKP